MLFDPDGRPVELGPHELASRPLLQRLPAQEYESVVQTLRRAIAQHDSFQSTWLLEALDERQQQSVLVAAGQVERDAAILFCQIVWEVVRSHPDGWVFYQPPPEDGRASGIYYFRRYPPAVARTAAYRTT